MLYPEIASHAAYIQRQNRRINLLLVLIRDTYQLFDWAVPPIGPAYISSYMKAQGYSVHTCNLTAEEGEPEDVLRRIIEEHAIDIVGIGDLVVRYNQVKDMVDLCKRIKPSIITCIGGSLVTHSPVEAMTGIRNADIGIVGEGEITTRALLETLESGGDLLAVNGLVLRDASGLVFTGPRDAIVDLDSLPFPDWEGFKFFELDSLAPSSTHSNTRVVSAPVVTSRGCPFSCTYCSKSGGDTRYRQRSLDGIFAEIDSLVTQYGVTRIFLDDELFAVNEQRLIDFCERIQKYSVEWLVYLRVGKHMTDSVLRLMKQSGCIRIFYGFESGDDTVLASMNKKITTAMIRETVEKTYNAGIKGSGQFIFGDIEETKESIANTFAFAKTIKDKIFSHEYYMIRLFPGSKIYDYAVTKKLIPDTLEFIRQGCPLVNISRLSDAEYWEFIEGRLTEEKNALLLEYSGLSETIVLANNSKNLSYSIHFTCPRCGFHNEHAVSPQNLAQPSRVLCENCHETHDVVPFRAYTKLIEELLCQMLSTNRVALWGSGVFLMLFYSVSDVLQQREWIQIDTNPEIQQKIKNGRMVHSPEILTQIQCDTIIVSAVDAYDSIKKDIETQFPWVTRIINLREIGFFVE